MDWALTLSSYNLTWSAIVAVALVWVFAVEYSIAKQEKSTVFCWITAGFITLVVIAAPIIKGDASLWVNGFAGLALIALLRYGIPAAVAIFGCFLKARGH